ncbi:aminotransferase class I/II-fold pyridoxal phosphate-dependent enzyme [Francisellaceae bacterium]|nr:aminotransferase class I/II-fold pyridoxal phosphate-dependent enzyme [Francisellaceae bacterium]
MIQPHLKISQETSIYAKMSQISAQYNALDMAQGVANFPVPEWLIDRLYYHAKSGKNAYSPIPGTPQLRTATATKIQQAYNVKIDGLNQVLITCGASEAIFATIMAYTAPGDEVIFFDPAFDVYPESVKAANGVSKRLQLLANGHIDLNAIQKTISDKTKIILLNSPHNPMGSIITKEEYQELARIIKGKDILVLSDEVYEHMTAEDTFTSALQIPELKKQLVVFQSFGKTYNLTGWRMGACIGPEQILKPIQSLKQNMSFSAPTPMQLSIADGINNHPDFWQSQPKIYQEKYKLFTNNFNNPKLKVQNWEGSPFLILDYTEISQQNDLDFAMKLVQEHGIGLVPISSSYEKPQNQFLRLCFAKSDDQITRAVDVLNQIS